MPINNPPPSSANWELIETKTLGGAANNFAFTGIPAGYRMLWMVGTFELNNSSCTFAVTSNNTANLQLSDYIRLDATTISNATNSGSLVELGTLDCGDMAFFDFTLTNSATLTKSGTGTLRTDDQLHLLGCQITEATEISTLTFSSNANFQTTLNMQLYGMV